MNAPIKLLAFVLLLLISTLANGSDSIAAKRPKIGLVLSGGGAKGIAHIGVLKAMEEAGLTPDYITGTSMGSIVGGLYSIGYSPKELEKLVTTADWDMLLTNKIPLDKVTFEEKQFYGRYLLDLYLKNKKLQYPSGVIEGQAVVELFSKLTRPVHNIQDFNKFPIPFACVGANIETGEPVVLNKGSLALAMRASMAIPTIFTPVKIDGKLLVDGGLVRNMPVDEVLDMGADIVIGVFVGSDFRSEENLKSLVSILSQSAFITSIFDNRKQLAKCNIVIQPDLKDFSSASFHSAGEIYQKGVEAGEKYFEVFKHLADSLKKLGPLHQIKKPVIKKSYIFEDIDIEGNDAVSSEFIIGKLRFSKGEEITIDDLEKKLKFLYGSQYFEKVNYQIINEDGKYKLKLMVVERPKVHLRFSYWYDTENKGGIIGNVTLRNLLLTNSRMICEAKLSVQPDILLDYMKYVGKKQNLAIGLSGIFSDKDYPFYNPNNVLTNIYGSKYYQGGFKIQSTSVQSSTFGFEGYWASITMNGKINEESLRMINKLNYNNFKFGFFYRFNNLNERYFPTHGVLANVAINATTKTNGTIYINDYPFDAKLFDNILQTSIIKALHVDVMPIIQVSKKFAIATKAKLTLSNIMESSLNLTEYDFVGGFYPDLVNSGEYYGSGIKQYPLANYFYGRITPQYEIKRNFYIQTHFNLLSTAFPVTFLYPGADTSLMGMRSFRFGYGGTIGIISPFGPLSVSVAKDHYQKGLKANLSIGFHF